jgi:hypothetical protein
MKQLSSSEYGEWEEIRGNMAFALYTDLKRWFLSFAAACTLWIFKILSHIFLTIDGV